MLIKLCLLLLLSRNGSFCTVMSSVMLRLVQVVLWFSFDVSCLLLIILHIHKNDNCIPILSSDIAGVQSVQTSICATMYPRDRVNKSSTIQYILYPFLYFNDVFTGVHIALASTGFCGSLSKRWSSKMAGG